MWLLTEELVKIFRGFIGRVKFTSQDLDHFSHTSGSDNPDGVWERGGGAETPHRAKRGIYGKIVEYNLKNSEQ